jgi:hypothetical protein
MDSSYDVFVSYSSLNGDFVHGELVPRLTAEGLHVLTDRDFELGRPSLYNMERAIRISRHTLLLITPEWIESVWCEFEGLMVQTIDPSARHGRIIPLLRAPLRIPPTLAPLTYLSLLPGTELEEAFNRLIRHLRSGSGKAELDSSAELISASGTNYDHLKELLAARCWADADKETAAAMTRAVGREPGLFEGLSPDEFEVFPCSDLQIIDQLWMKHSGNRFGFTAQRNQYLAVGGDRQRFGDVIGWRRNGLWIAYPDVRFDLSAPLGHLPIGGYRGGLSFAQAQTMSHGLPGFFTSQIEVAKSTLGDVLSRGGVGRFWRRLKAEITMKNGFALWWLEGRIALIHRLGFCRTAASTLSSA